MHWRSEIVSPIVPPKNFDQALSVDRFGKEIRFTKVQGTAAEAQQRGAELAELLQGGKAKKRRSQNLGAASGGCCCCSFSSLPLVILVIILLILVIVIVLVIAICLLLLLLFLFLSGSLKHRAAAKVGRVVWTQLSFACLHAPQSSSTSCSRKHSWRNGHAGVPQ